jgi:hypothetical protein
MFTGVAPAVLIGAISRAGAVSDQPVKGSALSMTSVMRFSTERYSVPP